MNLATSAEPVEDCQSTPLPALAASNDGRFFILARIDGEQALIQEPGAPRPQVLSIPELTARWNGELILLASRALLAVSFALQLFALVTPLFFQVVMDKVLVHRGFTTLDVIAFGFLVVVIFETVLSGLRKSDIP